VAEEEILSAMQRVRDIRGWIIEGAAAVAVAACLKEAKHYQGKTIGVVICGGNLSDEVRQRLEFS
jgi:threonine dehydratase